MKKLCLFAAILLGVTSAFASAPVSTESVVGITNSHATNKARFEEQYQDKTLQGDFVLLEIKEGGLEKNQYSVTMLTHGKTIVCTKLSDPQTIALLTSLHKGMQVQASGIIRDVLYGKIALEECVISLRPPKKKAFKVF